MDKEQTFAGADISKDYLNVTIVDSDKTWRFANNQNWRGKRLLYAPGALGQCEGVYCYGDDMSIMDPITCELTLTQSIVMVWGVSNYISTFSLLLTSEILTRLSLFLNEAATITRATVPCIASQAIPAPLMPMRGRST